MVFLFFSSQPLKGVYCHFGPLYIDLNMQEAHGGKGKQLCACPQSAGSFPVDDYMKRAATKRATSFVYLFAQTHTAALDHDVKIYNLIDYS